MSPVASSPSIKILIADDSPIIRAGLKAILSAWNQAPRLQVVGEADSVASTIARAERLRPDVVVLDLRLPDGSGVEAGRQILARRPETRLLGLTEVSDERLIHAAMSSGFHGYLLKEIDVPSLYRAIIDVAAGRFFLDPAVTSSVLNLIRHGLPGSEPGIFSELSPQERRVLALVAEGKTNKQIGGQMRLSDKTIKNYLSTVFEKLQITRRAQAAALYAESQAGMKRPPRSPP
ncbi:MAG: response regulator transcription factor [Opitutaceae bacterium]|nr:response regulator transcription factor [Opitutaceae bacterium]